LQPGKPLFTATPGAFVQRSTGQSSFATSNSGLSLTPSNKDSFKNDPQPAFGIPVQKMTFGVTQPTFGVSQGPMLSGNTLTPFSAFGSSIPKPTDTSSTIFGTFGGPVPNNSSPFGALTGLSSSSFGSVPDISQTKYVGDSFNKPRGK